jgi:hypothetical protein
LEEARARLNELILSWNHGVRFDCLIFLGGCRELRKTSGDCEEWDVPVGTAYETERDMLELLWNQTDVPPDMREHLADRVVFLNTPHVDGMRASTKDTYKYWLSTYHPIPGTVLASSGPLIRCYQHLVGLNALGPEFFLDTISRRFSSEAKVCIILDTIAKCLYEIEHQIVTLPHSGMGI